MKSWVKQSLTGLFFLFRFRLEPFALVFTGLSPDSEYPVGSKPAMVPAIREERSRQLPQNAQVKTSSYILFGTLFSKPSGYPLHIGGGGY